MYDVSAAHKETLKRNNERMKELEKEHPETYFNTREYRKLCEENRQAQREIDHYNRMRDMGVKF